jgi:Holliday junction resolvase RusA-like endonuclease
MAARDPITVTLLGEPVPFARMRLSKIGKNFVPRPQRNAFAAMRNAASDVMQINGNVIFDEPVSLKLRAVLPIPTSWSKKKQQAAIRGEEWPAKKPDLDNLCKLATDAFNTVIYRDDAQIVSMSAHKVYGTEPCLVVTIQPAERFLTAQEIQSFRQKWNELTLMSETKEVPT